MIPDQPTLAGDKPVRAQPKRPRRGCAYHTCQWLSLLLSGLTLLLWVMERRYVDRSEWAFTLTYGPQIVYVFVPLAAAAACLLLWQWRWVGYNLLLALVITQVFVRPTWPHLPRRASADQTIRVASWNLHEQHERADEITATLASLDADIVCLQEASHRSFRDLLDGYEAVQSHDVTTLTRGRIVSSRSFRLGSLPNWRYGLETVIELPAGRVTVLNVHWLAVQLPLRLGLAWGDQEAFERSVLGRRKQETVTLNWMGAVDGPALLVGDLNTPPNVPEYRHLARLATDAWEAGLGLGFTFHRRRPVIRIDYVWCRGGAVPVRSRVMDGQASDHLLLVTDIAVPGSGAMPASADGLAGHRLAESARSAPPAGGREGR